jgi:hypothetical protein
VSYQITSDEFLRAQAAAAASQKLALEGATGALVLPAIPGVTWASALTTELTRVAVGLFAGLAEKTWQDASLVNSWANLNVSTNQRAQFRRNALGAVELRGTIAGGSVGSVITSLPAYLCPAVTQDLGVFACSGGSAYVTVSPNGNVFLAAVSAGATPSTWLSLNGLSFYPS